MSRKSRAQVGITTQEEAEANPESGYVVLVNAAEMLQQYFALSVASPVKFVLVAWIEPDAANVIATTNLKEALQATVDLPERLTLAHAGRTGRLN